MGLGSSIFARAADLAGSATESLGMLGDVAHEARTGQSALGIPSLAAAVTYRAQIDEGEKLREGKDGKVIRASAVVTFFPLHPGIAAPEIKVGDMLTLPSGRKGLVIESIVTFVDPATGSPLLRAVWLG